MIETANALAHRHYGGVTLRFWSKDNPTVRLEIDCDYSLLANWSVRSAPLVPGRIVVDQTSSIVQVAKWCTEQFVVQWMHQPPASSSLRNGCISHRHRFRVATVHHSDHLTDHRSAPD